MSATISLWKICADKFLSTSIQLRIIPACEADGLAPSLSCFYSSQCEQKSKEPPLVSSPGRRTSCCLGPADPESLWASVQPQLALCPMVPSLMRNSFAAISSLLNQSRCDFCWSWKMIAGRESCRPPQHWPSAPTYRIPLASSSPKPTDSPDIHLHGRQLRPVN